MIKNRKIISIALVLVFCLNCFFLAACSPENDIPKDTIKIIFDYNDGGASRPLIKTIEKGKSISEPATPKVEGYSFEGWFTEKEGGEQVSFDFTPTEDTTLYAKYIRNKVKVTFDYNFKGAPKAVVNTVDYEASVDSAPDTIPVREGYTFEGWYTGKIGGQEAEFPYLATKDTTFYAKWTADSYNLVFDFNYEDGGQRTRTVKHDSLVSPPAVPSRVGYEFDGWFTEAEGGQKVSFPYAVDGDATIYAQWKARPLSVTFDYNYTGAADKEVPTSYGEVIARPEDPVRSGYTFMGWFTEDDLAVTFTETITESQVYYAHWTQKDTYKLSIYLTEDATESLDVYVEQGSAFKGTVVPTRVGWDFDGYFTAANDGEKIEFPYTPNADTSLYAHWSVAVYDVIFNYNYTGAPNDIVVPIEHGQEVTEPTIPARTGYTFAGWWTTPVSDGAQVTFPATINRAVTYYARWTPNPHTITFDFNFDNGPQPTIINTHYDATLKSPNYVRRGYKLDGWYTEREGGEKIDFATFTVSGDATFYAHWSEVDFTVEFRYNYTDAPARAFLISGVKQSEPYISAPEEDPVRYYPENPDHTDYKFIGWYTTAVGGVPFDFENTKISSDTNIYAHWEHLPMTPTNNTFHAEYVYYDPNVQYPGYSGYALGARAVTADDGSRKTVVDPDYRVPSTLVTRQGHFANYLYRFGLKLEFIIESSEEVSGVTLYAALASEMITAQVPHRMAPSGPEGYAISVNGQAIDYAPINLTFDFVEYAIATNVKLNKGTNTIVLMTNNTTSMGGTTYAKAPQVDYIRLGNVGNAVLTWKPIVDNLEANIL